MAAALCEEKIEDLWEAYQVNPSAQYVSKVCAVSRNIVVKYIRERHRKIKDNARTLADTSTAQLLAKDSEMVHNLKIKIAESIKKQLEDGRYKPTIRDYDSLVRLQEFLKGTSDNIPVKPNVQWKIIRVREQTREEGG